MRHLFSSEGLYCLERLALLPSILIFDFDGTLAPIVPHFNDANVPVQTARYLTTLSQSWPVAVITGRSVDDAKTRLGFTPDYLFGNHGAERAGQPSRHLREGLNACRKLLHHHLPTLAAHKVIVEDKGMSLALHYRQCDNPAAICTWLHELMGSVPGGVVLTDGHMVVNILLIHAPDKGDALLSLLQDCGVANALVVGDDDNDEAAFEKAPAQAVTVRIGPLDMRTRARFRLSGQYQLDALLAILLQKNNLRRFGG